MPLPIDYFQPETFAQANPFLQGMSVGQNLIANSLANQISRVQAQYAEPAAQQALLKSQLNNQILKPQAQYAPQMTLAELALKQAMPNYYGAQTGLIGTEIAKNQFFLNNPETLLPGVAGSIGGYALLQKMMPNIFKNQVQAPSPTQNTISSIDNMGSVQLPGMPSAGNFTGASNDGLGVSQSNNPNFSNITQKLNNQILGQQNQAPQSVSQNGIPNVQDFANMMFQGQFAPIQKDIAQTQFYKNKANLAAFDALPADTKANMIAQGGSLGMNPTQTVSFLANGGDLNKIPPQSDGSLLPIYAPSAKNISQSQASTAALSSLSNISPTITNALAPYSRKIFGYSPTLLSQELTGSSPDQQAQALAARALAPEIAALRLKAMNANVGIEAMNDVQEKAMLDLKNLQSSVSPKVFTAANQYMDKWIGQMNKTYNESLYKKPGQPIQANQSLNTNSSPVITKQLNGVNYQFVNGKWHQL